MAATRIMGLDLSLVASGIAHPDGTLSTLRTMTEGDERLEEIADGIEHLIWSEVHSSRANGVIDLGDHDVDLVVMEDLPLTHNKGAVGKLGMVHGVARLVMLRLATPYMLVPPGTLKTYAAGRGNATKADMRMELFRRTGEDVRDDNQVDAAWLRHLGLDFMACPILELPKDHRRALAKLKVLNIVGSEDSIA